MRYAIFPLFLVMLSGCGNPFKFDPATTIVVKVSGINDDATKEQVSDTIVALVKENSNSHKMVSKRNGNVLEYKISPVDDVQDYADRIDFGAVTEIDGRTIHVTVGAAAPIEEKLKLDTSDIGDEETAPPE